MTSFCRSMDNRDMSEMERSDKATIDALRARITELEVERDFLRAALPEAPEFVTVTTT